MQQERKLKTDRTVDRGARKKLRSFCFRDAQWATAMLTFCPQITIFLWLQNFSKLLGFRANTQKHSRNHFREKMEAEF
jgi:hypothetical protein